MDFVTTVWGAVVWVWEFMIDPEYRWWKIAFLAGMVVSAVSKEFFDGILKARILHPDSGDLHRCPTSTHNSQPKFDCRR